MKRSRSTPLAVAAAALFASPDSQRRSEDFKLFVSVNTQQLYDHPDRPAVIER